MRPSDHTARLVLADALLASGRRDAALERYLGLRIEAPELDGVRERIERARAED